MVTCRFQTDTAVKIQRWAYLNSQAVGMASWAQSTLKSILMGDPMFESAAWFLNIILKFIFLIA